MGRRGFGPAATLAAALLAGSAVITGCGSAGDDAGGRTASRAEERGDAAQSRPEEAEAGERQAGASEGDEQTERAGGSHRRDAGRESADSPAVSPSRIVRTASVTVVTKDVPGRLAEARTAVETAGGYVGDEASDQDASGNERSRVTLKVPPEEYEDVLADLSALGRMVERKVQAEDVTGQVVDTESRIRTQRASVARVRSLMDQATELSDVVTLESELSTRQAELESLQARLKSLEERTGMATVTLVLREPDAAPASDEDGAPSVGDALAGGWNAFVATLRWIVIVIGAAAPFAAAAALFYALWRAVRGRLPGGVRLPVRRTPVTAPDPAPAPDPLSPDSAGER